MGSRGDGGSRQAERRQGAGGAGGGGGLVGERLLGGAWSEGGCGGGWVAAGGCCGGWSVVPGSPEEPLSLLRPPSRLPSSSASLPPHPRPPTHEPHPPPLRALRLPLPLPALPRLLPPPAAAVLLPVPPPPRVHAPAAPRPLLPPLHPLPPPHPPPPNPRDGPLRLPGRRQDLPAAAPAPHLPAANRAHRERRRRAQRGPAFYELLKAPGAGGVGGAPPFFKSCLVERFLFFGD